MLRKKYIILPQEIFFTIFFIDKRINIKLSNFRKIHDTCKALKNEIISGPTPARALRCPGGIKRTSVVSAKWSSCLLTLTEAGKKT